MFPPSQRRGVEVEKMRTKCKCKCGGFDENFEVLDEDKIGECGICGMLVCECGLDESGQKHYHSESEEWII